MNAEISIVWFRKDLRISDNPSIVAASNIGQILPIYIADNSEKIGSASKIWLHSSLEKLNQSLDCNLNLYTASTDEVIEYLINQYNVRNIFCNKCYEPWYLDMEEKISLICKKYGVNFQSFNGNYLYSPSDVLKDDGSYYKVFTAYKNKLRSISYREVLQTNNNIRYLKDTINNKTLEDLNLIPKISWYKNIQDMWDIGEFAAQKKLDLFIKKNLRSYKECRNYPYKDNISKLSPHLHFGEISPAQILRSINAMAILYAPEEDIEHFISEIFWREFSAYLLYHFPKFPSQNFNSKFDNFGWGYDESLFEKWKKGETGYPIVDAGMRQLWQTGYMHNRVRMVVASFLVKNLNIHWIYGMDWFFDCLVDADLANNSASWQWVAGSGVDAAPYFRIFNPVTQGEKHDPDGHYTKQFVPELKNLPSQYLFKPWMASEDILKSYGVILGKNYPKPIVDFTKSRTDALARYSSS